jgi:predicted TIM-barrel fold metal-dependent hydrolase
MDRDVTVPIDSRPVHKLFRLAVETGIAFQIHYEIEDVLLPPLEAMLSRYPEAKVIWCHLGQVRYRERASHYSSEYVRGLIARFPNLYFDLGLPGPPHVHPASEQRDQMIYVHNALLPWGGYLDPVWQKLLEEFPERFIAATDSGPEDYHGFPNKIMRLRSLVLDQLSERARHLIAYQNAWRLLTGENWEANKAIQPIAYSAG